MSLLIKHTPPEYIHRMLNSPRALRYSIPYLKERAKQDAAWGDTLAYQRTMQRLAEAEREVDRQDALLEKALQAEVKRK
jgi:hypothetical protein